ncbi:MAG: hypothetical protein ACJAXV_001513 [Bacteroidia bacterium]
MYEEESSGELDTISVASLKRELSQSDNLGYKRDRYVMRKNSSRTGEITQGAGGAKNMPALNKSSESFVISQHAYSDQLFISTLDTSFIYELTNFERMKLKDTMSSISILDSSYADVRIFENLAGIYTSYQKSIYWARHVGKIRVERADGTVWNLIDYEVSQDNFKNFKTISSLVIVLVVGLKTQAQECGITYDIINCEYAL